MCHQHDRTSPASPWRFLLDPRPALAALALAGAAGAQVVPAGPESQVNSFTPSYQREPAIVADAAGNFVVVWQSYGSSGSDTSSFSIQAQRFDAGGAPQGSQFQVNSFTTSLQQVPAIAADAAGNFVVAWQSWGASGTDTESLSIQAQRYDSDGIPQGGQFQVNTYTTNHQGFPAIAADAAGNFVVVWQSYGSSGTDTDSPSIQAQRYDAGGIPQGGEFQVNTYTTSRQILPVIAADAAGNFVVAWTSDGSGGTDTSLSSVQAQRFDAGGVPQGGQFQVNSYTTDEQYIAAIAAVSAGDFVVAWTSYGSSGTDTRRNSIHAQRFDPVGVPQGGQFQVNTFTAGQQADPAIAVDAAGSFVVAWRSAYSSGTDTSGWSTQARRFGASGVPRGGQFQVNAYTTSAQYFAVIAADATGNFVVAWESWGSSGTDADVTSIQARRFDVPFFQDGVDSGDLSGWSEVEP